jgi:hypothetical protein
MRTKTLLLTAAVSAAGIASSMAQGTVFSVNAVGYVNTVVGPKFSLISNPLTAADNSIASLFKNGINGTVPDGFQVYKFQGTSFAIATYSDLDGAFTGGGANQTVVPGEGVFVRNPTTGNITITFVGEVPQGNLKNDYPAGLSIRSSQVPQEGTAAALGFQGKPGDQIYQFNNTTQAYKISTFDEFENNWTSSTPPALGTLKVGEAFFLRAATAGSWTRTFNVN